MAIDVEKARAETPGCSSVLHLNNAGAALMPTPVAEGVKNHLNLELFMGASEAAEQAQQKIQSFYTAASRLIGATPSEIAFTENASRAWQLVFYSLQFKPGDIILTAAAEYASNYIAFLQVAKKTGAEIVVIDNDASGQLCLKDLERKISNKVKLIAITHIPTQGGLINPAKEVGQIAKAANIFYLLDSTQSIGQLPLNVQEVQCDALCAAGRKFLRAPRGTGFLYVNQKVIPSLEPPLLDLQAATWTDRNHFTLKEDAKRFEIWERSYTNLIGLGIAIDYALSWGMQAIWERIFTLSKLLRTQLANIPGITLRDLGEHQCGIVTFTSSSLSPQEIRSSLLQKKINVSISLTEYARLDMEQRHLKALVRASVHYYNTEEEIERFCEEVRQLLKKA